ncbi:MAG: serine/threonine-protein kinase [Kofleriaceae bacterium]|nr:serine/threonine-protein kinase [Kofleriaceae bacterium]
MSEGDDEPRRAGTDPALDVTLPPVADKKAGTLPGPGQPPRAKLNETAASMGDLRDVGIALTLAAPNAEGVPHAETLPGPYNVAADLPSLPKVSDESYAIGEEIARGGMGKILSARDRRLRRDVVIKVTRATGSAIDPRFEREALITARLQHPSIVRVYDAGVLGDGRAFYAMERVRGRSLEVILEETKSLRDRIALLPHAIAVVDAIAYAHSEGVLHRDLKPANVLIGPFGETVVIDWGLAKEVRTVDAGPSSEKRIRIRPATDSSGNLTMDGSVMGTPSYMAPEQARGDESDERTDIYALGALLYTLLTGKPPHHGRTTEELLDHVAAGRRIPIMEREPGVPAELATIVEHAMAHERKDRFASAKELADELRRFSAGKLVARHNYTAWELVRRWLWKHRVTVGVAAVALVVLAVVGVISIRSVVRAKDRAEDERTQALLAQAEAVQKTDNLRFDLARSTIADDPSRTAAWLAGMSIDGLAWAKTQELARDAAARGLARILNGHTADVEIIALTPDGTHVVTASDDATLRIWNLATEQSRELRGHVGPVEALEISPDGMYVASAGTDGTVWLWELASATGRKLAGHRDTVRGVAFSPDGKHLVSTGEDGGLWLWDTAAGQGREIYKHTHGLRPLVWTRSNKIIVGGFDGSLGEFDALTHKGSMKPGTGAELRCFALSPDGTLLVGGDENGVVTLWTIDGQRIRTLGSHTDVVRDLAFTPNGKYVVSGGGDPHVLVYPIPEGATLDLTGNGDGIKDLDVSRDSTMVTTAGIDGTVRVWTIDGTPLQTFRGHRSAVKGVVFTLDRRVVSAAEDDRARIWRLDPDADPPMGDALRAWLHQRTNASVEQVRAPSN